MSSYKVGDNVWVKCGVVAPAEKPGAGDIRVHHCGANFYALKSECRPVEPINSPEIPDSSSEPWTPKVGEKVRLVGTGDIYEIGSYSKTNAQCSMKGWPGSCVNLENIEPVNSPEIPDSSSEPMREAFEAGLIQRHGWNQGYFGRNENQYFDSSVQMAWQAFQAGASYQPSPLAPSPCMDGVNVDQFVEGVMEARGRTSDPINPSHYKHLPAEAIDIIEAAIAGAPSNQSAFLQGQVIKYLLRCWSKEGIEDLRKAKWYLDRLVGGFDDLLAEASGANDGPVGKRYRTPTQSDLRDGPIACEYRDFEGEQWRTGFLVYVFNEGRTFLCISKEQELSGQWLQCRIEVGE